MNNKPFLLLILMSFSVFSQEKKILTYRKTIISPTYNLVLKNNEKALKIDILNKKETDFSKNTTFPSFNSKIAIAAFNEKLWLANAKNIEVLNIKNSKKLESIQIPNEITISQMAIGFNHVVFAIDNQQNSIYSIENKQFNLLLKDEKISNINAVLIIGGELFLGTENSILSVSISKKTVSVFAENLNKVLALETDYLMQILALTNKEVLRFNTKKEASTLMENDKNFLSFSMNPQNQQLFFISKTDEIETVDYSKLINLSKEELQTRNARKMKPFEAKDLILVGSEYLIHSNNENPDLRETVLEGFYPEKDKVENGELSDITPNIKTMECAEKSYQAFLKWAKKVSTNFKNTTKNTPPTFWLMVNDYSEIKGKILDEPRPAKVWYWKRKPAVIGRFPGFWKWEAVLTQDCKCVLPNEAEAEKYFKDFIK